jgi:tRNA-intron lyase
MTITAAPNPEPTPQVLCSLSLLSLRIELQRRGLSTGGVKSALAARLAAACAEADTGSSQSLSVPFRFPSGHRRSANGKRPHGGLNDTSRIFTEEEKAAKRARVDAVGHVMAGAVWVVGTDDMSVVWDVADGYGKGNLSRSEPLYAAVTSSKAVAKSGRAARQLLALESNKNRDPIEEQVARRDVEHLQLTRIEAFHASFVTHRIRLVDGQTGVRLDDMLTVWRSFCAADPLFAQTFAAYARYRRAGWMPRSGLKYGVDWVLYRAGSNRHAHSPYCVILTHDGDAAVQSSWIRLQNKLRLVKNVAKNLIAARVRLPLDDPQTPESPNLAIECVQLIELTIDRWVG